MRRSMEAIMRTPFGHAFLCMILPDLSWNEDGTRGVPGYHEPRPAPPSEQAMRQAIANLPSLDLDRDYVPSSMINPTEYPNLLGIVW